MADGSQSQLKALVSGACGGFSLVFAAHPFDLVKVRMQTSTAYTSTLHGFTQIIKQDGLKGMYRGVSPVLTATPPILALNFWAFFVGQQIMHSLNQSQFNSLDKGYPSTSLIISSNGISPTHNQPPQLSLFQIGCAGAFSSIPTSFLIGPAEQIKIRLQIQETSLKTTKVNAFTVASSIIKTGGPRALFRGTGLTFLRDVPTGFVYFATYEGLKRHFRHDGQISMFAVMFSGGCAGCINWFLAMPIDVIKSRVQSSSTPTTFFKVARDLISTSGPRGLFKGLGPTLIRAFPASAAFFFGVEGSTRIMNKMF